MQPEGNALNERSDIMSPHAVNSLVTDLVQMAKAMEELPQVQADLTNAIHKIDDQQEIILHREAEITSLRQQIATMATKISQTEVDRDDAELRFLELEERFGKLATAITTA